LRSSPRTGNDLLDQTHDFAGFRVALLSLLGENTLAVRLDLEHAAGGLDELDFRMSKRVANLGRQTGGPRLVVSDDAVLDRHLHVVNDSRA
jgi:hypothetical protein